MAAPARVRYAGRASVARRDSRPRWIGNLIAAGLILWVLLLGGSAIGAQQVEEEAVPVEEGAEEEPESRNPCEPEDPSLITFEFELSDESGGGSVIGWAGSQEGAVGARAVLSDGVKICYQDIEIQAERLELDFEQNVVTASGDVVFDEGPRRLTGETLEVDLDRSLGRLTEASAYIDADFFFEGTEIAKVDEDTYTVVDGTFTSCEGTVPPWSFRVRRARVRIDGYARIHGATLLTKNVPIFYVPYILWPARAERTSGFLVPKPGYSSRRGASLGLAYYQVLGRSYDTTFELDLFSRGAENPDAEGVGSGNYLGFGNEFRYRPSETTEGSFQGYLIQDPELDETRWRLLYDHKSDALPWGMRGVVHLEDVSDRDFFRDFERTLENNTRSRLYSSAFISGNWGIHSFNLRFDQDESLSPSAPISRNLPAVEYRMRQRRLGPTPFYLQLDSSVNYLDVDQGPERDNAYARANVAPTFTLTVKSVPWLSLSANAGGRFTWYGDSLFRASDGGAADSSSDFSGESLSRFTTNAGAEIVGPTFARVFEGKGERFSRFRHIIEPRFSYLFVEDFDEQDRINIFDRRVDGLVQRNVGTVKLVNRLMAKPAGDGGNAREIFSLELSQQFSFDDDRPLQRSADPTLGLESQAGPIRGLLKYNPSAATSVRFETRYNTLFSDVESVALSGDFRLPRDSRIRVTWRERRNAEMGLSLSDQIQLATRIGLVPSKLDLSSNVHYDLVDNEIQQQRYFLNFRGSCYGISLEFASFETRMRSDFEYRLAVTLKNVGSFFDITGGRSNR